MKLLTLATALMLTACNSSLSSEISAQALGASGRLDMAKVGGTDWERVCFLAPYSSNDTAEKVLGFAWDAEQRTDIQSNEGITVVIFVKDKDVVAYTEHPRRQDFARLGGQCFPREKAVFVKQDSAYVHGV